jgi:hypothetical protein
MRSTIQKSILRRVAFVMGATAAAVVTAQAIGCSSAGTTPGVGSEGPAAGSVGLSLTLPGGESLNSVLWTITDPTGAVVQQNTVSVQNSLAIDFVVSNLAPGITYTITLAPTSAHGTATCAGSASFSVTAHTTTNVSVLLRCSKAGSEAGSIAVGGQTYDCASVSGASATPSETAVGTSIALSASASGVNSSALGYTRSAPSGTFSAPGAASTNFTCTVPGPVTVTLTASDGPVSDGGSCGPTLATTTVAVICDPSLDAGTGTDAMDATVSDASDAATGTGQALFMTLDNGVAPIEVTINQGTAIGEGALNGATPATLTNLAADTRNTQSIVITDAGAFLAAGNVPDTAAGFCSYPHGGPPTRVSYITGSKFETTAGTDPMVPMAPFYFPLVYTTVNTTADNAFGGQPPIIGLFDWRPKDIDEGLVAAESTTARPGTSCRPSWS